MADDRRKDRFGPGWWAAGLALGLLLGLPASGAAQTGIRPNALSVGGAGDVIIGSQGGLFRYSPRTGRVSPLVRSFGALQAIDMCSVVSSGKESIYVSLYSQAFGSRLVRYDARGVRTGEWWGSASLGVFAGIAVEPLAKVAYVAVAGSATILKVDLSKPEGRANSFARVAMAATLGPMVLDTRRARLLAADPVSGDIFAVGLKDRRVERLATIEGEPSALALDPASDDLFIADSLGRKIWRLPLGGAGSRLSELGSPPALRKPLGLALDSRGTLWVGDEESAALLLIDRNGRLLRKIDLRHEERESHGQRRGLY